MKLAHFSDTHLGHRGQGRQHLVADPWSPERQLSLREVDIMQGLVCTIDYIIERIQPDAVIHTGDLFDASQPTPQAVHFAMAQLRRLPAAGIPLVLIEGNHSSPRDHSQGHILRLFEHLAGISVVCADAATVRVNNLVIHAIPHRAVALGHRPRQGECERGCFNVLATHAVADGREYFTMGRAAAELPISGCATWYDYVALGHYHRFAQIQGTDRAFYAGATSMVTWRDFRPSEHFSFNVVQLDQQGRTCVERIQLPTRPMHAYGLDEAVGLSAREVLIYLEHQIAAQPPDEAYCRVSIAGLEPLTRRELSVADVDELFSQAAGLVISLQSQQQGWNAVASARKTGGDPLTRFTQLTQALPDDEATKAAIQALGHEQLTQAIALVGAEDVELARPAKGEGA